MDKFRQISTELWPLIYGRNWFSPFIFGISSPIFFKVCMSVDVEKECLVLKMGTFCQKNYRVTTLDLCSKLRFARYLFNKWVDFDKKNVFWHTLIRSGLG